MDKNNIISEGILDKILKSILPTAANTLKDKSNKSYVSSTENTKN